MCWTSRLGGWRHGRRTRAPDRRPSGLTATISVFIFLNADCRENLTGGAPRPPLLRYRVWRRPALSPEFTEHAAALADLCRRHRVQRLELFGSAATGQDDPARSDLDFLVEFEPLADGHLCDATSASSRGSKRCSVGRSICGGLCDQQPLLPRIGRPDQDAAVCGLKQRSTCSTFSRPPRWPRSSSRAGRRLSGDGHAGAAVERQCEIIGEALAKLAKVDEPVAARIRLPPHHRVPQHPDSWLCRSRPQAR